MHRLRAVRPLVLLLFLLIVAASRDVRADGAAPRVERIALVVRLDPPRGRLIARADLSVRAPEAGDLEFDLAAELAIVGVALDEEAIAAPTRDGKGAFRIAVPAGDHRLRIAYRGRLHDEVRAADDLAWVAGDSTKGLIEPHGVFLSGGSRWVPWAASSPLALVDVEVFAPDGVVVACQGGVPARETLRVAGFDPAGDALEPVVGEGAEETVWLRSTFPAAIATDSVSLSAGDYVVSTRVVDGVSLSTYFYPRHQEFSTLWLDAAADTVRRYTPLLGAYPHPKFDIVENFFQSGYGMPSFTLLGDRVIEYVSAKALREGSIPPGYLDHEYVHGWYGNGLFVDFARGNWCEAITTYLSNYYAVELAGGGPESTAAIDARRGVLERFAIRVHGDADVPLRAFLTKTEDADNDVGYGKGSMVFHLLRRASGSDEAWWSRLATFTQSHVGHIVAWEDFAEAWRGDDGTDPFASISPWLERPGLPRYRLTFATAAPLGADAPEGEHEVEVVVEEQTPGGRFGGRLPVVVTGGTGASTWTREGVVVLSGDSGSTRVRVPGPPTRVELDPAWHVAKAIPRDELPLCLQTTLRAPGEGAIVVRGDESAFAGLVKKLESTTGWPVVGPDFDLAQHDGPAIVLWMANEGEVVAPIAGRRLAGAASSLLATVAWNGHPRTWYVAASPAAARRAGYVPFYGWDTWVRFENGVPERRAVERPPSRSLTFDLRAPERRAEDDAAEVVRRLAATERGPGAPERTAIEAWVAARMPIPPLDPPSASDAMASFDVLASWTSTPVTFRYTGGHRQGEVESDAIRPVFFSASSKDGSWQAVGGGQDEVSIVRWTEGDAAALWHDARERATRGARAIVYVVEDAAYAELAPLVDRNDALTPAAVADRNKVGRDGRRIDTGPLETWLSGRRARANLGSAEALSIPILLARRDAMPASPDQADDPFAWIEEVVIEFEVQRTMRPGRNLVFRLASSAAPAEARRPALLLMAHLDAVPGANESGPIHPGADDNASGVACLLDVARRVAESPPPAVDILFAFPDAEEWGLLGSRRLVDALRDRFDVRAVVNVDSVGRGSSKPTHVIGASIHTELASGVAAALKAAGIEIGRDIDRFAFAHGSDHWPFHEAGVPAVSLWASDYAIMNRPDDRPEDVEAAGIVRLGAALAAWVASCR